jgi:hypothetical protein
LRFPNPAVPLSLAALASAAMYLAGGNLSLADLLHRGWSQWRAPHAPTSAIYTSTTVGLPSFDGIVLKGGGDATIAIGAPASIAVDAVSGRATSVSTEMQGGRLIIRDDDGHAHVTVTMPHLKSLQLEGSGHARLSGLREPVTIGLDGPGEILATGEVDSVDATVNGPGKLDFSGLRIRHARVVLNGKPLQVCGAGKAQQTVVWPGGADTPAVPPAG